MINRFVLGKKFLALTVASSLLITSFVYVNAQSSSTRFDETYISVASWPAPWQNDQQLRKPQGMAVDNRGYVYVVDTGNARVLKFTDMGKFVSSIGNNNHTEGHFKLPYGIALDSRGNIYVTDQLRNSVHVFTSEGNFTGMWGTMGSRAGEFRNPVGITTDKNDNVYIVDNGNKRIQKFNSKGEFILKWGTYGPDDGNFIDPFAILADPYGFVYVIDKATKRIQKFNSNGEFITSWGSGGKKAISISDPSSITVDLNGNVYVSSSTSGRVYKLTVDGVLLNQWSDNEKHFSTSAITVDGLGYVYVLDYDNSRVLKFGTITSTWQGLQGTMNVINQRLNTIIRGSTSATLLIPSSVQGTVVKSGNSTDVFGETVVIGDAPSLKIGDQAKITGMTIQNKDSKNEHKIRIQLGFEDRSGEFAIRQDLKVILKPKGMLGDSLTLSLPQPFFVPSNQLGNTGTNVLARISSDAPDVPVEVSVSGILNP